MLSLSESQFDSWSLEYGKDSFPVDLNVDQTFQKTMGGKKLIIVTKGVNMTQTSEWKLA